MTETQGETSVADYPPSRPLTGRVSMGRPHSTFAYAVRCPESGEWLSLAGEVGAPGVKGELYIGGPAVVPGYYARSDGTILADDKSIRRFQTAVPEVYPELWKRAPFERPNISSAFVAS